MDLKLDAVGEHVDLYLLAFLEGDKAAMQHEADWAKGRTDEFVMLETIAEATAASGRLQQATEIYRQAVDSAQRAKLPENAAGIMSSPGSERSEVGNTAQARELVRTALAMDRSRPTLTSAGYALGHSR